MNFRLWRLIVLLCVVFGSSAALAKTFKIATLAPDGTAWMKAMRAGAAEIREKTQGRVKFKFYPGGVMGSSKVVLRKMRIGQLQGGAITIGDLAGILPDLNLYGLPFLFHSLDQVDRVRQAVDPLLIKELEDKGFVSFGFAEGGFSYMMSDQRLDKVADVRHKKVWIPTGHPVGAAVFKAARVSPVQLPLSDVMTGLQTGLIDTVISSPIAVIALQWHTQVKYAMDEPLTYFAGTLVIARKAFRRLKSADQKVVRTVMNRVYRTIDQQNRKDNLAARKAMMNQGIQFEPLTAPARSEWHDVGEKATIALTGDIKYSKPVYDRLTQLVRSED